MMLSVQAPRARLLLVFSAFLFVPGSVLGQGVTTAALNGIVTDQNGDPLPNANVVAVHEPSQTQYRAFVRAGGAYNIPNMRIGGPYTVTISLIGFEPQRRESVHLSLAQTLRLDFQLARQVVELEALVVTPEQDEILNADRTGAATFIDHNQVLQLPSIKRSTRDMIRLDPLNDGNFSFAGRNWLYNNISLDGSYFNNSFGLDDPALGGQTNAEPIPFDAVEQVQVSIAPYDVRQSGFTGANINIVTKSGTNQLRASVYSFFRNESFVGNTVSGGKVIANPDLTFNQSGFTVSGPLVRDKLFFFVSGEIERTDDPGTNFVANRGGAQDFGESRVDAAIMDSIRSVMSRVYDYDTGPYEGFIHETNNDKLLVKLDWNINDNNNLTFRYNFLDGRRDLPPHPFVLSAFGSGRGPNENSLPFQNSGYQINNELNSFALEINSRSTKFANRFFASYSRLRDFREPFSRDFPTLEIAENFVQYTSVGHETFSIRNILDTDIFQFTDNFSLFSGKHAFTFGANFEVFKFFNSFNIFRHGFNFLPSFLGGGLFFSLADFFDATDPTSPNFRDFNAEVGTGPFKGEVFDVGQLGLYVQDELLASANFNLTFGLRVDFPIYFTDPVDNPFSRGLTALDGDGNPETVDQSDLPGVTPLFSPRVGFNWDVTGDRSTQVRGGTGIFTGRLPFVWVGNVFSNPGANPNIFGPFNTGVAQVVTSASRDAVLQQSFDVNAMVSDFKWPQVWTTNVAIDQRLPGDLLGTLEFIYGKDINAIFMRNADLVAPVGTLPAPDGRPFFGSVAAFDGLNELNADGGAGIYVIDNSSRGHNVSVTAQLRKSFDFGLNSSLAYTFTEAKSLLKSTEIASVLFSENPIQGNPNKPVLSHSEFGNRHRIIGAANFQRRWSDNVVTSFGLFFEVAEGNRFAGQGGNRYSFTYAGDVNGDGFSGNDLIYIPTDATDPTQILFADPADGQAFEAFIRQDDYLSSHRGEIAERFGAVNPWFFNIDLRILQDFAINTGGQRHAFQLSIDVLNVANLLNSDWGVRKVASSAATIPLALVGFDAAGAPILDFTGPAETFIDDPGLRSRWQAQIGIRYLFN